MPTLSLYFGENFGDEVWRDITYLLDCPEGHRRSNEWILGRLPDCDLTISVKDISKKHASISYSYAGNVWSLQDLGSSQGTFLRGKKLIAGTSEPIAIGDKFWLATNMIAVVEDDRDTVGRDDGPPTVASTQSIPFVPTAPAPPPPPPPAPPPSPPPPPRGPWDTLHFVVSWAVSASTPLGVVSRLLALSCSVALAILAWQR